MFSFVLVTIILTSVTVSSISILPSIARALSINEIPTDPYTIGSSSLETPSENADAMWVEPLSTVFDHTNGTVAMRFNVTVWLNMNENIFAYQVGLHYNRTQLKCTRADFTGTGKSNYFAGHTTTPAGPFIDTSSLGNGSVAAGESLSGDDFIPGPKSASLIWIEFQILIVPSAGNFTSKFDLSTETLNGNNYVLDTDLNTLTVAPYDSNYLFIAPSPPPPQLSVSISANTTSISLGQSVLFGSIITGGIVPYTYQWYLNSTQVLGATSTSWTFTPTQNGSFTVSLKVTDMQPTTVQSNLITIMVLWTGLIGDVNGDGRVDIRDVALVAKAFGQTSPPASPSLDLNNDGRIDIRDIAIVAKNFGKHL